MQIGANGTGGAQMGHQQEESMKERWLSSVRAIGFAGVLGLTVAGCSSYNPLDWGDDSPPAPEQIALPAEASADAGKLPEGLGGDGNDRSYDKSSQREDVTVVRPLRENVAPPDVTVSSQASSVPQQPVEPEVATSSDLPGQPPIIGQSSDAESGSGASAGAQADQYSSVLVDAPDIGAMQGLDAFSPEAYGVSFLAATIPFNHGSSSLSASDMAALKQVVAQFKDKGGAVTVIGHASSRTGDMSAVNHKLANFNTSLRRAQSVARALQKLGVPSGKLFVGAVSDNEPLYQEVMPAGEAGNRRTEVFLNQ